jgi:uncharacterized protein (DUF488 family)
LPSRELSPPHQTPLLGLSAEIGLRGAPPAPNSTPTSANHWLEVLGGRRHQQRDDSPNLGLENEGFRNYADYVLTDEFREGVKKLLEVARRKRTAIMCAEGLFWQCHRRLVSDFLAANGVTVQHIMPDGELRPHKLMKGAVVEGGRVTYPGERSLFT